MAEAEDVITDVARHATIFARDLWHRHRPPPPGPTLVALADVASRLDLIVTALFATRFPLRVAQPPPRQTLLSRMFRRELQPVQRAAVPSTDGNSIWLPRDAGTPDIAQASAWYRVIVLQQAMRATRGSAALIDSRLPPVQRDVFLILEALAADEALLEMLPGIADALNHARCHALATRPAIDAFHETRRPLERFLRHALSVECGAPRRDLPMPESPSTALEIAAEIAKRLSPDPANPNALGASPLLKDHWTGDFRQASAAPVSALETTEEEDDTEQHNAPRSSRLDRRPEIREPEDDEDDDQTPGPWMVQPDHPHEHAEDPMGLQRPLDRDEDTSAAEFGELLSELPNARLVSTPGRAKEILLSDDPPEARARAAPKAHIERKSGISYPEWDYREGAYRSPGATVWPLPAQSGPQHWVDGTLADYRAMLGDIRRRFEMLRAEPVVLRRRLDGDEIDLEAYLENHADYRAGLPRNDALYQTRRPARRSMAIMLLIDVSGSTDGWIAGNRRIIDVEREALLLVSIALDGLAEPFAIQGFSGEGLGTVTVRELKSFDEPYGNDIALRIGALEPEHYTRAGAALRHATAALMRQPAEHRLLLLLSDGKPNDNDEYEGRYGVEDMRQAVTEATLQGIYPFCLTIDRQAANYLPRVFGAHRYGLLPEPRLLPTVLLEWMKRLLQH